MYVRATDSNGNTTAGGSESSDTFTIDTGAPSITNISATSDTDSVVITWTTDEQASSKVDYGLSNSYGSSTAETDTSPRVTSHSVSLSSLVSCTTYHYRVRSKDTALNETVSSDGTFTTTGCAGSSAVLTETSEAVTTASGGTVELTDSDNSGTVSLTIPASYTSSDTTIQVKQLNDSAVTSALNTPLTDSNPNTYTSLVSGKVYDFKALTNTSAQVTNFDQPITVTMTYHESEVVTIDEYTIAIYRYNTTNSKWQKLTGCLTDTLINTTTCTTTQFSTFGLFGAPKGVASSIESILTNSCNKDKPGLKTPQIYSGYSNTPTSITINFTPSDEPYDHYGIEYGTKPNTYTWGLTNIGDKTIRSYTINLLKPNTTYYIRLQARNGCTGGDWGNEIAVTTKSLISPKLQAYQEEIVKEVIEEISNLPSQELEKQAIIDRRNESLELQNRVKELFAQVKIIGNALTVLEQISQKLADSQNNIKNMFIDNAKGELAFIGKVFTGVTFALNSFYAYVFDENPTVIKNVTIAEVGKDYVIITWETNHPTYNNKVNYGTDLTYGNEIFTTDGGRKHTVKITGLKENERYYFEVMSQNRNYAYDAYYSFVTK